MGWSELTGTTALVTGASRGFGRGIATALHEAGADVVAVARTADHLGQLRDEFGGKLTVVAADAADPVVAGSLIEQYRPKTLVLNAGAPPLMRPLQQLTWETFSRNWEVDVQQAFHWIREALLLPLAPQSTVITMSSGAALFGSPLSGGYAGAKAAIRFMTAYARREGIDVDQYVGRMGPGLGPDQVGKHIAELASSTDHKPGAYLLAPDGLKEIS
ncbi:MAG: SDR family oxidoreductase [Acidimicrobiia bacterium]